MKADDVVVLEIEGEGKFGEHYLIGVLRQRAEPHPEDVPLSLDVVENDQDRTTAFDKARRMAAGGDVFFTQRGRPGHLQDHYNSVRCPKCGFFSRGFEFVTHANGATGMLCPACKYAIEIAIREP
jgi:DNA-directed RNA polymerase subunit RPC12/RpoP